VVGVEGIGVGLYPTCFLLSFEGEWSVRGDFFDSESDYRAPDGRETHRRGDRSMQSTLYLVESPSRWRYRNGLTYAPERCESGVS